MSFDKKAREIVDKYVEVSELGPDDLDDGHVANIGELEAAISTALKEAVEGERSKASAAVVAQAYWRHQGATPDRNTQTEDEIYRQDEEYERNCLLYMVGELGNVKPLTDVQMKEIQRRASFIRSRKETPDV